MTDLQERLRGVDRAPVPDLWLEVQDRATSSPSRERRDVGPGAPGARRLVTAGVVLAVFAAAAVFAWRLWTPTVAPAPATAPSTETSTPDPTIDAPRDPWRGLPPGFNRFAGPPSARTGPATTWTGDRFVVWGGGQNDGEVQFDDGWAFDPTSDSWSDLSPSPLSARSFPASVWTGSEIIVWGGWNGKGFDDQGDFDGSGTFDDGAAYDPATDTWRMLAPAPLDARTPRGAVWTGRQMIVWGSQGGAGMPTERRDVTGAAYDPATDTWRTIADAPHPINWGSVAWSGEEMYVLGASVHQLNHSDTPNAVGMAYDPVADTWRELPPTDLDPNGTFATWARHQLFAFDYSNHVRSYIPDLDAWRNLPKPPTDDGEAWPRFAVAGDYVFAWTFGGPAVFDLVLDKWDTTVEMPPALGNSLGYGLTPVGADKAIILWGNPNELLVWVPPDAALENPPSLPKDATDALACAPEDHVAFRHRGPVILPGGSAFIAGNVGGIDIPGDRIVQVTFEDREWYGVWHVRRDGSVIAVVDWTSLSGFACAGSGVAGA